MPAKSPPAKVLLRACPRCQGDLFPDDEDFACLQCGRRVDRAQLSPEAQRKVTLAA